MIEVFGLHKLASHRWQKVKWANASRRLSIAMHFTGHMILSAVKPDLRAGRSTCVSQRSFRCPRLRIASSGREHGEKVVKADVIVSVGDGAGDKLTGTSIWHCLGGGRRLLRREIIVVDAV